MIKQFTTAAGVALASLAVVVAGTIAAPVAHASPSEPNASGSATAEPDSSSAPVEPDSSSAPVEPDSSGTGWTQDVEPNATQWLEIRLAEKTAYDNGFGQTLDYQTAIDDFQVGSDNHTDIRREFAAGWLSYRSITNITAGELDKIKALQMGSQTPHAVTPMNGTGCTGKAGKETLVSGTEWREWYNSCQTTNLLENMGGVPWVAGTVGAILAAAGAVVGYEFACAAVVAIEWGEHKAIANDQANSKYNAIVVTTYDRGGDPLNGTRYIQSIVEPQNGQYG